jgi:hypothetical protein
MRNHDNIIRAGYWTFFGATLVGLSVGRTGVLVAVPFMVVAIGALGVSVWAMIAKRLSRKRLP